MTDKQRKALEALERIERGGVDREGPDRDIYTIRQALTEPVVPDATEEMVERIGWDGFTLRDLRHVLQVVSESCEPDAEPAVPDLPLGAIHNGREFIRRLEEHYDFECEAGPLSKCAEWDDLKRCFDYLSEHALAQQGEIDSMMKDAHRTGAGYMKGGRHIPASDVMAEPDSGEGDD